MRKVPRITELVASLRFRQHDSITLKAHQTPMADWEQWLGLLVDCHVSDHLGVKLGSVGKAEMQWISARVAWTDELSG